MHDVLGQDEYNMLDLIKLLCGLGKCSSLLRTLRRTIQREPQCGSICRVLVSPRACRSRRTPNPCIPRKMAH